MPRPGAWYHELEVEAAGQLEVVRREQGPVGQDLVAGPVRHHRAGRRGSPRARTARRRAAGRGWSAASSARSARACRAAPGARADRGSPTARRARAGAGAWPARWRSPPGAARPSRAGRAPCQPPAPCAPRAAPRPRGARPRRDRGPGSAARRPRPRATVGMNSWSSGSWKTRPTRRRSSDAASSSPDLHAGHLEPAAGPAAR